MFKIKNNCPVKTKCIILTKRRTTRILINQIWKDFNQKDLWSNLQENTMLKDIHIDQIQPCRRKKTVSPYICRMFFRKYKPLDANICSTKTPIPCRMIFKKIKQQPLHVCIYLLIKFHRIYHFLSTRYQI